MRYFKLTVFIFQIILLSLNSFSTEREFLKSFLQSGCEQIQQKWNNSISIQASVTIINKNFQHIGWENSFKNGEKPLIRMDIELSEEVLNGVYFKVEEDSITKYADSAESILNNSNNLLTITHGQSIFVSPSIYAQKAMPRDSHKVLAPIWSIKNNNETNNPFIERGHSVSSNYYLPYLDVHSNFNLSEISSEYLNKVNVEIIEKGQDLKFHILSPTNGQKIYSIEFFDADPSKPKSLSRFMTDGSLLEKIVFKYDGNDQISVIKRFLFKQNGINENLNENILEAECGIFNHININTIEYNKNFEANYFDPYTKLDVGDRVADRLLDRVYTVGDEENAKVLSEEIEKSRAKLK